MRKLTEFSTDGETTTVPVVLDKFESAFIVFREKGRPIAGTKNFPQQEQIATIKNGWDVQFNGKLTNPTPIHLEQLQDLATSKEDNIKYFSGNMIYSTTFDFDQEVPEKEQVYLDLGEVAKMAKVWVNNQYVGGVWTYPYAVDISQALKQGTNTLRIDVVNTWVNRLIGDTTIPKEERETWVGINPYNPNSPLQKTGLIGPVSLYKK